MASSGGGVPPGFRFHPTDEELLHYYLRKKVTFQKFDMEVIREVDLNKMEPWELQERCKIGSTPQNEWYFFSHKDRKYPTGSRTNRATNVGFWKATGRDKCIRNSYKKIGMRKTLVFYKGRAPHGQKTDWIMHEYRLEENDDAQGNNNEDGWVICRVFKKKNLFKVHESEGGSSMNSGLDHHHEQLATSLNTCQQRSSFMHRPDTHHYLLRQHPNNNNIIQPSFELDKHELALHYSHNIPTSHQYSIFHSQTVMPNHHYSTPTLHTPDSSPIMLKQLMTSHPKDCDSTGSENLRYPTTTCEPGIEVDTCTESTTQAMQMVNAGRDPDQGLNEWAMLDRFVTSHLGAQDSASKSVRFEESNLINHLSLRGEMDLWGYTK